MKKLLTLLLAPTLSVTAWAKSQSLPPLTDSEQIKYAQQCVSAVNDTFKLLKNPRLIRNETKVTDVSRKGATVQSFVLFDRIDSHNNSGWSSEETSKEERYIQCIHATHEKGTYPIPELFVLYVPDEPNTYTSKYIRLRLQSRFNGSVRFRYAETPQLWDEATEEISWNKFLFERFNSYIKSMEPLLHLN